MRHKRFLVPVPVPSHADGHGRRLTRRLSLNEAPEGLSSEGQHEHEQPEHGAEVWPSKLMNAIAPESGSLPESTPRALMNLPADGL